MTAPTTPLVVFAYDFPHKKTQDVILRAVAAGHRPEAVLAAPPVRLRIPPAPLRVKPRHVDLVDPASLCRELGIDYIVVDHNSVDCQLQLGLLRPTLGVVAGARVLSEAVIDYFPRGVVNFHPGLLPGVRGLDAL